MSNYDIILLAAGIVYVCVSSVYDAYENLSGGRVRKLEETAPVLAEKLDKWLEQNPEAYCAERIHPEEHKQY